MSNELATTLMCPTHGVALEYRPHGEVIRALRCPSESDSLMSTANRYCTNCGASEASWMSGTCSDCYRRQANEAKAYQSQIDDERGARGGIRAAIEKADGTHRPEVATWLRDHLKTLP